MLGCSPVGLNCRFSEIRISHIFWIHQIFHLVTQNLIVADLMRFCQIFKWHWKSLTRMIWMGTDCSLSYSQNSAFHSFVGWLVCPHFLHASYIHASYIHLDVEHYHTCTMRSSSLVNAAIIYMYLLHMIRQIIFSHIWPCMAIWPSSHVQQKWASGVSLENWALRGP